MLCSCLILTKKAIEVQCDWKKCTQTIIHVNKPAQSILHITWSFQTEVLLTQMPPGSGITPPGLPNTHTHSHTPGVRCVPWKWFGSDTMYTSCTPLNGFQDGHLLGWQKSPPTAKNGMGICLAGAWGARPSLLQGMPIGVYCSPHYCSDRTSEYYGMVAFKLYSFKNSVFLWCFPGILWQNNW